MAAVTKSHTSGKPLWPVAATYDTPRIAQRSNGTIDVQNNRTSDNATKQYQHWVIRIHKRPRHHYKGCIYHVVPFILPSPTHSHVVGTMPFGQDKAANDNATKPEHQ